jgi:tetraacyldisaccharide 4'-kinase
MKLTAALHAALQRAWQRKGMASALLLPLSALARLAVARKQARYRKNPSLSYRASLPVIVVGNVYVGGTGKTPVVIELARALRARGWNPGIISRGYGAKIGDAPRTGQGTLPATEFGDEPALIAASTQVPIAVHPNRPRALQALQKAYPEVDVIIADDGLQHLALARDIEIVVQDARGIGNGRMLPAGPLREPPRRLRRTDFLITNLAPGETPPPAMATRGRQIVMQLHPGTLEQLDTGETQPWEDWLARHGAASVAAVAAIGRPERFFAMLRHAGLTPDPSLPLPDHYAYKGAGPPPKTPSNAPASMTPGFGWSTPRPAFQTPTGSRKSTGACGFSRQRPSGIKLFLFIPMYFWSSAWNHAC